MSKKVAVWILGILAALTLLAAFIWLVVNARATPPKSSLWPGILFGIGFVLLLVTFILVSLLAEEEKAKRNRF